MIYFMIENLSGSVIRSQVIAPLAEISRHFDLEINLVAMERVNVWEESDALKKLRQTLEADRIKLHTFLHYGNRHPLTYINLGRMLIRVLQLLLRDGRQVMISRNFHSTFPLIPLRRLFRGSTLVLDLRGAFVQELVLKGSIRKNGSIYRLLSWMERRSFAMADKILAVSENLALLVQETVEPKETISVIPCCVDSIFLEETDRSSTELNLDHNFVVVYAGSQSSWNLVDPMIDLFQAIIELENSAHFLFLTLRTTEAIEAFKRRDLAPNLFTVMAVDQKRIQDYLSLGDLGLLLRENNVVNQVASPVKLGEYLASGVPVCITPHVGDLPEQLIEQRVGLVVDLDRDAWPVLLAPFIDDVKQHRKSYRQRCKAFARDYYNRENYLPLYQQLAVKEGVNRPS